MATTRSLLNEVLVGLRKEQIATETTSLTDSYHTLLLQFVNSAKAEAEDAWDWRALRSTVTITLAASTVEYTLTSAGDADMDVGPRSRLLYENPTQIGSYESSVPTGGARAQVFDVTDASEFRLTEVSQEHLERLHFTDQDETIDRPYLFALYNDGTSLLMKVWPTPSEARTLKARFVVPQADLPAADITTSLSIPARPVWQRALFYANQERGDDLGRPNSALDRQATMDLANAIIAERTPEDDTGYPE